MNINRHNYESYFLLYIDKELSDAEMQAVVEFINQNPDLKAELEQLELAILPDEDFSFINKDSLYKKETISEAAEMDLLLLLDGELSFEKAAELTKELGTNKILAAEWELLQQTKLISAADEFIFENKELLYRKEEKARPVFYMLRWAAAAALLGMGFYAGFKMLNRNESEMSGKVAVEQQIKPVNTLPQNTTTALNNNVDSLLNPTTNNVQSKTPIEIAVNDKANVNSGNVEEVKKAAKYIAAGKENNSGAKEEPAFQLAVINKNYKIKEVLPAEVTPDLTATLPAKRPALVDINIMETPTNNSAFTTAFNNTSNDRILYMDKEVIEKTKVGRFLKKVKSTLSRDIEIESGRSIKIAGFEIARQ